MCSTMKLKAGSLLKLMVFIPALALGQNSESIDLLCTGAMEIGSSGVDIGSGVTVSIKATRNPKTLTIMGHTYELEESPSEYIKSPKDSYDAGLSLDRTSLDLTWIVPKYSEEEALVFRAICTKKDTPRI